MSELLNLIGLSTGVALRHAARDGRRRRARRARGASSTRCCWPRPSSASCGTSALPVYENRRSASYPLVAHGARVQCAGFSSRGRRALRCCAARVVHPGTAEAIGRRRSLRRERGRAAAPAGGDHRRGRAGRVAMRLLTYTSSCWCCRSAPRPGPPRAPRGLGGFATFAVSALHLSQFIKAMRRACAGPPHRFRWRSRSSTRTIRSPRRLFLARPDATGARDDRLRGDRDVRHPLERVRSVRARGPAPGRRARHVVGRDRARLSRAPARHRLVRRQRRPAPAGLPFAARDGRPSHPGARRRRAVALRDRRSPDTGHERTRGELARAVTRGRRRRRPWNDGGGRPGVALAAALRATSEQTTASGRPAAVVLVPTSEAPRYAFIIAELTGGRRLLSDDRSASIRRRSPPRAGSTASASARSATSAKCASRRSRSWRPRRSCARCGRRLTRTSSSTR